jgi:hypothetical protein
MLLLLVVALLLLLLSASDYLPARLKLQAGTLHSSPAFLYRRHV